jgi:two-component sensor histidine kinase
LAQSQALFVLESGGCAHWDRPLARAAGANSGGDSFRLTRANRRFLMTNAARETEFLFPPWLGLDTHEPKEHDALIAELHAARAREKVLLFERRDLSQRQAMLAQEFEHRLINGLQLIVSLLSLQKSDGHT